ncbi:cyclin-I-like [Gigantopelta aegis]|uniref:cyclin-I-like n=1 Tax=Gigantopelta aegis TaxID=1735272 RepID=UPI001B88A33E|nr:cyclin-I-like [Gigantopelta aegis]
MGMRLQSGLDARQLMQMLGRALHGEEQQWKPLLLSADGPEISAVQRDDVAVWLFRLNNKFHFMPETGALAISLLDRFLRHVKVRPRYLQCVAVSCLYIAAKTLEEDEIVPITVELVRGSQCGCSVAEVLRMEAVILNKLSWDIRAVTAIDFLHVLHALLMWHTPHLLDALSNMTPSDHLALLTRKLFTCLCNHEVQRIRPATVVLSLLSLELEQILPSWLPTIAVLQSMTKVKNEDLIRCREMIAGHLVRRRQLMTGYSFKECQQLSKKRKVEQTDTDEIYDSIKRLYNEEEKSAAWASCGSVVHQDSDIEMCAPALTVCAN